jgi:hypothetical protein
MPSLRILAWSVVRFIPSLAAVPSADDGRLERHDGGAADASLQLADRHLQRAAVRENGGALDEGVVSLFGSSPQKRTC